MHTSTNSDGTTPTPAVLSIEASGRYIGCGRTTMYGYISTGRIPVIRHGRRILLRIADLDRLLDEIASESSTGNSAA